MQVVIVISYWYWYSEKFYDLMLLESVQWLAGFIHSFLYLLFCKRHNSEIIISSMKKELVFIILPFAREYWNVWSYSIWHHDCCPLGHEDLQCTNFLNITTSEDLSLYDHLLVSWQRHILNAFFPFPYISKQTFQNP